MAAQDRLCAVCRAVCRSYPVGGRATGGVRHHWRYPVLAGGDLGAYAGWWTGRRRVALDRLTRFRSRAVSPPILFAATIGFSGTRESGDNRELAANISVPPASGAAPNSCLLPR